MYNAAFVFLLFFIFSILGWLIECISCTLWTGKLVHNRGFLIGPYCPIYGIGCLLAYYFLGRFEANGVLLFFVAIVGTSILEYLTSVLMEKVYKARWWDYSNQPFNLNGRICLKNSIMFGTIGLAFTYYIKPFYDSIINRIPDNTLIVFTSIIFILFTIDCIVSLSIMSKLKNKVFKINYDSTEDIDKEVKKALSEHRYYSKKLFKAFPGIKLPSGDEIIKSITDTLNTFDLNKKLKKNKKDN